jgi:hypothetical protein
MLHSRVRRLAAVAGVVSASFAGVFVIAGPASATFVGIKCAHLTGNVSSTFTLSGCNGNTGGASQPVANLATGGPITWVNGKSTTFGKPTISSTEHDADPKGKCPAGTAESEVSGAVTADTTGSAPVPGKYKLEVCLNSTTGAVTNEPGSKIKIG